jgi:hypothetical protein
MKKFLQLKKLAFLCMLVLLFSGPISAQTLVIFAIDTVARAIPPPQPGEQIDSVQAEQVTMNLFLEDGYDVQILHTNDGANALSTYPQETLDWLDGADLIVIGRRVASLSFDSPDKELWNALYPPIMTSNQWALRSSRMNWFSDDGIGTFTDGVGDSTLLYARLENPGDEIFEGLEDKFEGLDLTDSIAWWYGPNNIMNPADFGNGTVMATAHGGMPCWIRFDHGDEFYPGSVDKPQGDRVYFGLGCEVGNVTQYYSRYTEVSKEIYLREAARLSGHPHGLPPEKVENPIAVTSKVYFYPVDQKLVVEMDNLIRVEVIDISGKLVCTAPAKSNRMSVDLGYLARGIYLVKLTDQNRNFSTKKFMKY